MDAEREKELLERVEDLTRCMLHMFTIFTGQKVNEFELRRLIEKLGAHTRTKIPEGVKL